MRVLLVTPAPPGSRSGNRVTASRWAEVLSQLGHRVSVDSEYRGQGADLLVALHARRSAEAVRRFREEQPGRPIVLALTGTDVYGDIHEEGPAREVLALADRYVVLQPLAIKELPPSARERARVVHQSVSFAGPRPAPREDAFEVAVLAHLRPVKDPLRAAAAARRLPGDSRVSVVHAGGVIDGELGDAARREAEENPRYRWLGEVPREEALRVLARARLLVLSSRTEGGANVVSEALAAGTPVLSSRVAGSVGLLGDDYPGYFEVGDTEGLAGLLDRAERDTGFLADLEARCAARAGVVAPAREVEAWRSLLEELSQDLSARSGSGRAPKVG